MNEKVNEGRKDKKRAGDSVGGWRERKEKSPKEGGREKV